MKTSNTKKLATSAVLVAMATAIAMICEFIPVLHLPFGGGFTIASMLPIVLVSYLFGLRWGFLSSFVYSTIQILFSLVRGATIYALFTPASDDFMGYTAAIWILILDYIVAYTILGIGGIFRTCIKNRTLALVLGVILALTLRYLVHIVSGYIFYGAWAEWFFGQDGLPLGEKILSSVHGKALAWLYSTVYNGLYMIPEIIITSLAAVAVARIPYVKKTMDQK
ncbi:MAG: energy-coupled thiamine transporter ThiT [Clostridia bacterium]|nr:energy-coupled thiamine transporter ThiT [Clostridia bacterium]